MAEAPQPDIRVLVAQLSNPRTRRAARQQLVALRAADALVKCLLSHNEMVVWSAVQSLGELKSKEALHPLVDLLERNVLAADVSDALTRITGQGFGADARQWRQWLGSPASRGSQASRDELLRQTVEYLGADVAGEGDAFHFKLPQPDDRQQNVRVQFGHVDAGGDEFVIVYSECGPAEPRVYEAVLRKNLSMSAGAFGIRDVAGTARLVIVDALLACSLTARQLAKTIESIAARADVVERSLTDSDAH